MKTTDHLKSLIHDLKLYERELQDRVRQKEAELELLLVQRLETNGRSLLSTVSRKCQLPPYSTCQLPIECSPERTQTDGAVSPSPPLSLLSITKEKRCFRSPLLDDHHKSEHLNEAEHRQYSCREKQNISCSIDMSQISPIVHVGDESVDSESLAALQLLQTTSETTVDRPVRRVHFVSCTPEAASDTKLLETGDKTVGNVCGAHLAKFQMSSTHTLRNDDAERGFPQVMEGAPRLPLAVENVVAAGWKNSTDNYRETSCLLLRKRRRRGKESSTAEEKDSSLELVLPDDSPVRNSTSLFVLHKCNSVKFLQKKKQNQKEDNFDDGKRAGESNVPIWHGSVARRQRSSDTRSVSAARPHAETSVVQQQEGRGAGIVIACGPTLIFD